jgi:CcmD family protein
VSNEWQFVVAAYAITWVVLIGYAFYAELRWRRARQAHDGGIR